MNRLKKKIFICNFTKTISSAVLTAIAINIIMTNATKFALIEGILPLVSAIIIVAVIDLYEYRCEKEDEVNIDELEERIKKLEADKWKAKYSLPFQHSRTSIQNAIKAFTSWKTLKIIFYSLIMSKAMTVHVQEMK